ncbi:hypothetical protein LSAT2_021638 [Lamellibrachia satsuma]|nr:hypothetical protein LSAT2_021638 [Lamellibrachia satsuma]
MVNFYFDELTREAKCFSFNVIQEEEVKETKPAFVVVSRLLQERYSSQHDRIDINNYNKHPFINYPLSSNFSLDSFENHFVKNQTSLVSSTAASLL